MLLNLAEGRGERKFEPLKLKRIFIQNSPKSFAGKLLNKFLIITEYAKFLDIYVYDLPQS